MFNLREVFFSFVCSDPEVHIHYYIKRTFKRRGKEIPENKGRPLKNTNYSFYFNLKKKNSLKTSDIKVESRIEHYKKKFTNTF